ncbi:MAG: YfcE family phosphodiesterase [Ruminococcaceae bacterium]|nr:YfcE family phosphodiesterase [Oscillospiraceae bacterium]
MKGLRIVVISDSHKRSDIVEKILYAQPDACDVFFLGDCAADIEDLRYIFTNKRFHILSGNCDYFSAFPSSAVQTVGNTKIFYTHGHTLSVKYGIQRLKETAKQNGCQIALYGHTHISKILYEDGIYIVNPGSCACGRDFHESYAVIDIEENGIMPIIVNL